MKKKILIILVLIFSFLICACQTNVSDTTDLQQVIAVINSCSIEFASGDTENAITQDIKIKYDALDNSSIVITSDNESVISSDGKVTRQAEDAKVKITIKATYGTETLTKTFTLTVLAKEEQSEMSDLEKAGEVLNNISVMSGEGDSFDAITKDVQFFYEELYGVKVTITSDNEDVVSNTGKVTRPEKDTLVTITCTVKLNTTTLSKSIKLTVKGTGNTENDDLNTVLNIIASLEIKYASGDTKDSVTSDLEFVSSDSAKTTWKTNNDAVSNTGVVTRGKTDVSVTITATVTLNQTSLDKSFTVNVLKAEAPTEYNTVANIRTTSLPVEATISNAVVVCVYAKGFLVNDGTGAITVFLNDAPEYTVGDVLTITGTTVLYRTSQQFDKTCNIVKTGTQTYTDPQATKLTVEYLENYVSLDNPEIGKFLEIEGKLVCTEDGYYNIQITGTEKFISINYPAATSVLTAHADETVTVKGYTIGRNSTNERMNLMMSSINGENKQINEDTELKTISQLLAFAAELASGKTGSTIYHVKGQIKVVSDKESGKFTITDDTKESIVIYGAKDSDGTDFKDMAEELKAGYTVELKGQLQNYYGTIELCNVTIISYKEGEIEEVKGVHSYYFANYEAGEQYKKETHVLDENLTLTIENCFFTDTLRMYSSNKNNGYAIGQTKYTIKSLTFSGQLSKSGTDYLLVYGSTDGTNWTKVGSIEFTGRSKTASIDFDVTNGYTYFKLDVEGTLQLRISDITINVDEK